MSDVDRFRAAATTFDRRASRQEQLVGEGSQVTREMHATAALLRAVADDDEKCTLEIGGPWNHRASAAALALAAVILGDNDE